MHSSYVQFKHSLSPCLCVCVGVSEHSRYRECVAFAPFGTEFSFSAFLSPSSFYLVCLSSSLCLFFSSSFFEITVESDKAHKESLPSTKLFFNIVFIIF